MHIYHNIEIIPRIQLNNVICNIKYLFLNSRISLFRFIKFTILGFGSVIQGCEQFLFIMNRCI